MKNYLYVLMPKGGIAILVAVAALGMASVASAQITSIQPGVSAITPTVQQIETGPILDVIPDVLSDGYTINLTI
ncbi:MAG TPA: hypothetical protein VGY98_06310, partial [Verrucomicrobiae bacterium]|nr:hypothetical protein [Verrucomicrobiae bacterium]